MTKESRKHLRGFGSMDPQRQREIASMGGKAAHEQGTAYTWSGEAAKIAGKKGAEARKANRAART